MAKRVEDLPIEAGVYTEQTARGAVGRWKDSDKVRFRYGLAEKIGGWVQVAGGQFIGLARRIWDWASLDTRLWVSMGTEAKLYLFQNSVYFDITPLRRLVTLVDPINTTISSDLVTITDASHGAQVGDYVRFSGANPVGGLTIDGEYQIQSVTDVNNYVIQDDQVATSSASGGGTVPTEYDISVGLSNTSFGVGWNTGTWSQETWNTPRTVSSTIELLRTWSLDNWGEDLIAVPRGGSIYWWDRGTGPSSRANVLPSAPESVNYMIISQRDRHMFALGCTDEFTGRFDPLLIRWCSKEDFGDWTPTSTNTAGDLRLYRGSAIQAAARTRGEIIVWTDVSVHQVNYLGGTAVYGIQTVGENVSILSPNAAIEVDYRVFFMAEADFYVYDGVLRVLPCDVRNRVYDNLTVSQKQKVFAGLNREFNEIWFFYPAKAEGVWGESDFTGGLNAGSYQAQTMSGTQRYEVTFNASGYVYLSTHTASTVYDSLWQLQNNALIETPLESEYEASFTLNGTTCDAGVFIDINDFTGTADSGGDNVSALCVTVNAVANRMNFRKREALGTLADMDNAATFYDLSALTTPITLTDGRNYAITVRRSGNTITAWLYDEDSDTNQQVAAVALSAGEQAFFTGSGVAGVALRTQLQVLQTDDFRLRSFRFAPAGELMAQGEVGVSSEVNSYAVFNYQESTWAVGSMVRTAWADRSPVFNKPYAAGTDMYLYQHETGADENGAAMNAYIESYDMEIPNAGEYLMHVDQLIPDFLDLAGTVDVTLKGKRYPQVPTYQEKGPYTVSPTTRKISTRIRGRQIALRIESDSVGDKWRMGTMRGRMMAHGKR